MSISVMLRQLSEQLKDHSDSPRLDAELLLMASCGLSRAKIYAYPEQEIPAAEQKKLDRYLKRRQQGEPIAYILGHQEFWSLDFIVTKDTLIPRPETECLVEWCLNNLANKALRIADIGTGSGAIAIALAHERPHWQIDATDQSKAALAIAEQNAKKHQLKNIFFYQGDLLAALPNQKYDAIISNPPYIDPNDPHLAALQYEPQDALIADKNGLAILEKIIISAKDHLKENGFLILEHGYQQAKPLIELLAKHHYQNINNHLDLAKLPRFIVANPK